jgi:hypothetical protein
LGSGVPFATRTLTLECATVDVVVDGGRVEVEAEDAALK